MVSTAAKLWFGIAGLAFVAAVVYSLGSGEEWFGSFVLGTLVVAAAALGFVSSATNDGDVDPDDPEAVPAPVRRALPAPWPALGALGAGVAAIGLAGSNALLYAGFGILGAVLVEWMVSAWAERRTADPATNQAVRNRIMYPIEIPVLAAVGVAVVVLPLSRVLLAVSKEAATVVAIVVAIVVLAIAALIASRPRVSSSVLSGILALGAVALIAGGIASAVAGEREFEHHGEEHATEDPGADEADDPAADEGGEH